MSPYQQRVLDELTDLTSKLVKLVEFIGSDTARDLDDENLGPLMKQVEVMLEYQRVLVMRIRLFDKNG